MMDAFDIIAGGCVVAAAAGIIVAALRPCKCDGSRGHGLLRDALDVVAQLGDSPGELEQLLRLWTAGVGSVGQEQWGASLAVCVDTGGLPSELKTFLWVHLVRWCRGECRRQGWVACLVRTQDQQIQQWLRGRGVG